MTAMTVENAAKVINRKNSAPQTRPPAILTKTLGSVTKIRLGPARDLDAVAEAGGEDDQPGRDGDEGIQHTDAGAFAQQRVLFAHIATEDFHGGDAQAEGEERLVHGGGDDLAQADGLDRLKVGHQIEADALLRAGEGEAVERQDQGSAQTGRSS